MVPETDAGLDRREADPAPGRVLAVYAHPDDPDISCGGTLALWSAAGSDVHVCLCCDGDKGSLDASVDGQRLVRDRRQETEAAGREIGVGAHHWLGYRDGEVDDSSDLRARLVALVRRLRPDAVLAPDPTAVFFGSNYINHRDHRMVGWAVIDAVSPAAANPHYFPGRRWSLPGPRPLPVRHPRTRYVGRHHGHDRGQSGCSRLPRRRR